jgi:hypothetical protein
VVLVFQLSVLREERRDEVQGFLFSAAVPLKETYQLLGVLPSFMSGFDLREGQGIGSLLVAFLLGVAVARRRR